MSLKQVAEDVARLPVANGQILDRFRCSCRRAVASKAIGRQSRSSCVDNPGAEAVANDLRRGMRSAMEVTSNVAALPKKTEEGKNAVAARSNFRLKGTHAAHLNDQTYLREAGGRLAGGCAGAGGGVKVVMVHEGRGARRL